MTLGRMFLTLLLVLIAGGFAYAAVSVGWKSPEYSTWRFLLLPALGLLAGAWFTWPR